MPNYLHPVDVLADSRWADLVHHHPRSSVFQTTGWLSALQKTYGYKPVAFTTTAPGKPLKDGLVFCEISSWATGRRLVSLPFSDHCDPLIDSAEGLDEIVRLSCQAAGYDWKYIELRPRFDLPGLCVPIGFLPTSEFWFHSIDISGRLADVLQRCHPDCVRRKVRRAEREGLSYERGNSEVLLRKFYSLLVQTRRRHLVFPQPIAWFRNLLACLNEQAQVRVASKDGIPIAAILTLTFRDTITYKYGCSDERFHKFGGMPLLFWRAIQEANDEGYREFDLGRSDCENSGLVVFKEHLGAARERLVYFRHTALSVRPHQHSWMIDFSRHLSRRLPDFMLRLAGRIVYRHVG